MARTVIDVDLAALREAAAELGTTTKVDTVNAALREIAARRRRRRFFETLENETDFFDPEVMRGAWRR